jgi:hypothetical protein
MVIEHYHMPRVTEKMVGAVRLGTGIYFVGVTLLMIYFTIPWLLFAIWAGIPLFFLVIKRAQQHDKLVFESENKLYKETLGWLALTQQEFDWLYSNDIDCTVRVYCEPDPEWDWRYVRFHNPEGKFLFDLTFAS